MKEHEKFKLLKQKAIEHCDIPRITLTARMNAQKKAIEIRGIQSPSRLSYAVCGMLTN